MTSDVFTPGDEPRDQIVELNLSSVMALTRARIVWSTSEAFAGRAAAAINAAVRRPRDRAKTAKDVREMRALVMNLRTAVIGRRRPLTLAGLGAGATAGGPTSTRRVWFDGGWLDTPVYRREHLSAGATLAGPAIVEQLDATTVIEPGDRARVDALGNLEITVGGM